LKLQTGNLRVEQQAFGSTKDFRYFVLALVFVSGISVATADSITGTYKTITIDGSLSDWDAADLMYPDAQITDGTPLNTTYSSISVANDGDFLYIGLALKGSGGGDVNNNIWRRVFIDNDMDSGTGFDGDWTFGGYDRMLEYGNRGKLSNVYEFVGSDQTAWSWKHLGPIRRTWSDSAMEWAIPMNYLGMGSRTEMRIWFEVPVGGDVTKATYAHRTEASVGTYTLGARGGGGAGGAPSSIVTGPEKSVQSGKQIVTGPEKSVQSGKHIVTAPEKSVQSGKQKTLSPTIQKHVIDGVCAAVLLILIIVLASRDMKMRALVIVLTLLVLGALLAIRVFLLNGDVNHPPGSDLERPGGRKDQARWTRS